MMDTRNYPVFRDIAAPLWFIPETIASPVTSYMDAANHPPESSDADHHVYMSYVGYKTMKNAMELDNDTMSSKPVMTVSWCVITLVDTAWFPVALIIDSLWIVTRPNPEELFKNWSFHT